MMNCRRYSIPGILGLFALCGVMGILSAGCGSVSVPNPFTTSDSDYDGNKDALVDFYNATEGAEWSNNDLWLTDLHIGTWYGVHYYKDERLSPGPGDGTRVVEGVAGLSLEGNGLRGEIPPGLASLNFLSRLFLGGNRLGGEIPSELGNADSLTHLYLQGNDLSGKIPSELGKLDFLSYLLLHGNDLSGGIPSELGNIRDLITLNLSHNNLSGEIPSELGSLRRLSYLYLDDNQLTGKIPPELGRLRLETLYLGGNRFTGCIPSALSSVGKHDFLKVGLDFCDGTPIVPPDSDTAALVALYNAADGDNWRDNTNWLTSEPPCRWYGVSCRGSRSGSVLSLNLRGNNLSGNIPPELGNLFNLRILDLADNDLSGDIPSELGSLGGLSRLYLNDNRLNGQIPSEVGNITGLIDLNLADNNLSGEIPPGMGNLERLASLHLRGNRFTGCLPLSMASIRSLDISDIGLPFCQSPDRAALAAIYKATGGGGWKNSTNWLSDEPLFKWHGVVIDVHGRVQVLNLRENRLSGEIPGEFDNLANLALLDLHDNELTGEIPPALGNLAKLTHLDLHDNKLSGEIPAQLGSLANLRILNLEDNRLDGDIPYELGNLANRKTVQLKGNQLTGCIPAALRGAIRNFRLIGLPYCNDAGAVPDRAALVALYNSTDGNNWIDNSDWLTNKPLYKWYGVSVDDAFRVSILRLDNNRLSGGMPPQLGDLTNLTYLDLKMNRLTGEIPPELGNLAKLRSLYLRRNRLTGCIPSGLSGLQKDNSYRIGLPLCEP